MLRWISTLLILYLDCASCLSQQLRGITLVESQFCTLYDLRCIQDSSFLSDVNNDISNSKNDDKYYSLGKSILGEHLQAFAVVQEQWKTMLMFRALF
jgi:hypothetical protein